MTYDLKQPPYDCTTLLYCESAPEKGGETLFASCEALWKRLSPDQQEFLTKTTAVYSNRTTAGGPAAIDCAYGLRMNVTGTRRIRAASRRRDIWKLNERKRKLWAVNERNGEKMLWASALSFDCFEGMDPVESQDLLEEIMVTAFAPCKLGSLNEDLETISATTFDEDVVLAVNWEPGMAVIWDNTRTTHSRGPCAPYVEESQTARKMLQVRYLASFEYIPFG